MHSCLSLNLPEVQAPLDIPMVRANAPTLDSCPTPAPLLQEHRASLRHPLLLYTLHRMPLCTHQACLQLYPPTTMYCPLSSTGRAPAYPLVPLPEKASLPFVRDHIYCALMQVNLRIFASPPLHSFRTRWASCHHTAYKRPVAPCIYLVSCNVKHLDCIKL